MHRGNHAGNEHKLRPMPTYLPKAQVHIPWSIGVGGGETIQIKIQQVTLFGLMGEWGNTNQDPTSDIF